jgi:hypothetical protein
MRTCRPGPLDDGGLKNNPIGLLVFIGLFDYIFSIGY